MIKVGIIIGSTRPGRIGGDVAQWVHEVAIAHGGADYEVVDLKEADLPHLDEPSPALMGTYSLPHTTAWADTIAAFDAYVFVTPEYNRTIPGALKTAIDFLYAEWTHKSAGFVSYGVDGGVRAVEHLRNVLGAVGVADVRFQTTLSLHHDFVDFTTCQPRSHQTESLTTMLDEVVAWGTALKPIRGATAS